MSSMTGIATHVCGIQRDHWGRAEDCRRSASHMPTLEDLMDFDHVVEVHEDGTVSSAPQSAGYAPTLYDGALDTDSPAHRHAGEWSLLSGYTGQYGGGNIMHNCESIGTGTHLERDILAQPGYYTVVVATWTPEEGEDEDTDTAEGWGIAYKAKA